MGGASAWGRLPQQHGELLGIVRVGRLKGCGSSDGALGEDVERGGWGCGHELKLGADIEPIVGDEALD